MAHETPSFTMADATSASVSVADTMVGGRRCIPPSVASRPSKERLLMVTPSVLGLPAGSGDVVPVDSTGCAR